MKIALPAIALVCAATTVLASPVTYDIDPAHTYPSFEADHMGGMSVWRGKFTKSTGTIVFDKDKSTGTVEVTVDTSSIDFGHEKLNEHAKTADMFNVEKFPTAIYKGKLTHFQNGQPTEVEGEFTLLGVTKPLTLHIDQFLCKPHPMTHKDMCGADATGTFDRSDYGMAYGKQLGFKMQVKLSIQVEAVRQG